MEQVSVSQALEICSDSNRKENFHREFDDEVFIGGLTWSSSSLSDKFEGNGLKLKLI